MIERILFVSIFKEGEGGGEGRVAHEMARWFAQHYDVAMLCAGDTTGFFIDQSGFKQFQVESSGEGSICVPLLSAANVSRISDFLDRFRPDVIHVHDPALLGVIAQLWAIQHQVPVFYTAHILPGHALDFGVNEITRLTGGPISEALAEGYLLSFYKNCDAVIGLNATAASEIREFGYTGPLFVIPNGRDLQLYNACRFADINSDTKNLVFVGFISRRKNQAFLLEVLRYLPPNYHLRLIGEAVTPAYQDELAQLARKYQLNVAFAGKLAQTEVAAALEKAHVFVSASKREVQSLVIIEALASGTPVVGMSNETVDELVDSTAGIWLPKDVSPSAFAAAIRRICELGPEDYQALCEGARRRVQDLDWSNIMAQTIQSYETIVAQPTDAADSTSRQERLLTSISYFPAGKLRDSALEIATHLTRPSRKRPKLSARVWGIAALNMAASVILYYALKRPVLLMRQRSKERL